MRKIILFIASSLDGYIARENENIDWLFSDQDYGYTAFLHTIDTVLMGGKTYRQILGFGGDFPYASKNCYVFTHDILLQSNEEVTFIHHDIIDFVKELKEKKGKDIWLIGGSQINGLLQRHGLIDEIQLFLHPVLIGNGIRVFDYLTQDQWFSVQGVEEFDTGLIKLVYRKK
ncbi:MAG: dihydrofolate reductase family protein [Cyclobacteriaceae bacterium]|nr:dihydrofolate reductase family protein [Cyclobacteriaceae bacterium]